MAIRLAILCVCVVSPRTYASDLHWQLGEVREGQVYQTEIEWPSDEPRELRRARPSCNCITARILNAYGITGSPARVHLQIDTTGLESPFRKHVYVQTDSSETPVQRIVVSGTLITEHPAEDVVIRFFYDPAAPSVDEIESLLNQLKHDHGARVEVQLLDMTDVENYTHLYQLEDRLGVERTAPVEIFVGDLYLIGKQEIQQRLLPLVTALLQGEPMPLSQQPQPHAVSIHLYHTPGCRRCAQAEALLRETQHRLARRKPPIHTVVEKHDLTDAEEYAQLIAVEDRLNVLSEAPVSIFVGDQYFSGIEQIQANLERAIVHAATSAEGSPNFVVDPDAIQRRFRSFSFLAVLGAGLLDGLNPCAFTTLVFFISMLAYTGRRRNEIALIGICFGTAVFATYVLIGLGVFRVIQATQSYPFATSILYDAAAGIAIAFALYSLYDAVAYARSKRGGDIKLQLPMRIKRWIHQTIRSSLKTRHLAMGAIAAGVILSLLESVCTGQVYLPTIALVARDPALRSHAVGYLLLYNVMFALPLAVVFALAYLGLTSERLADFAKRNLVLTKLLTASLFIVLALYLLI